jgi:hypothetical protein
MAKPTPPYHISKKQKEWAAKLVETGSQTEAAMRTYDCKDRKVAKVIGSRNASNPKIRSLIAKHLRKTNLVGKALQKLEDQIEAKMVDKDFNLTNAPHHVIQNKAAKQSIQLGLAIGDTLSEEEQDQNLTLDDNTPEIVLEWIVENGREPTEQETNRLLNDHKATTDTTTERFTGSK